LRRCEDEANNRALLNIDTWYTTDAKPLKVKRDQSFKSSKTLRHVFWDNGTDVSKVPRSFEAFGSSLLVDMA
jgi:hypothetical protein